MLRKERHQEALDRILELQQNLETLENEIQAVKNDLIDEKDLLDKSSLSQQVTFIREDLFEEDLALRGKLNELESAITQIGKQLKPTLQTMEHEITVLSDEIKAEKDLIEKMYDDLQESR